MRTVSAKSILAGVLRREGGGNLLPEDATAAEIAMFFDFIADRFRTAREYYPWPECYVTEEWYFRAEYDAGETYAEGDEVRFTDSEGVLAYWRALEAIGAGESPETDPDKWEELTTFRRLVEFAQAGATEFEACVGAWTADPLADAAALRVDYRVTADGVVVDPAYSLGSVWLRVRTATPDFAAELWVDTATYAVGDVVYYPPTGECYRVVTATTAADAPDGAAAAKFQLLEFPMIFARAVKAGALADWQRTDGQGSAVKTRDSEERFIELLEEQVFQLTKLQGQTGRLDVVPSP